MVEQGELEYVEASPEHAELLMSQAQGHLDAAERLIEIHPPSAFTLLYEGARKAMTAVLAKQGLRPTREGGHVAVQAAAEAQLGKNTRHLLLTGFRQPAADGHDGQGNRRSGRHAVPGDPSVSAHVDPGRPPLGRPHRCHRTGTSRIH